jgi:hypothetical protein
LAPADPDDFHRTIANLQHKAQLLEREITRREEAERLLNRESWGIVGMHERALLRW